MPIDPTRVRDLFLTAIDLPPERRPDYLAEVCGTDAQLRAEVEQLLAAHAEPDSLLESGSSAPQDATGAFIAKPDAETATAMFGDAPNRQELSSITSLGTVIADRYTLVEVIGEGGMGSVYLAEQTEPVKRQVALKLIKTGTDSKGVLARFDAERQALALMDHPNIARIYDGGVTPAGQPFFVMELVHGVPLTEYCDAKRLSVDDRLQLFVAVCQAVQHAHQKGIIHRDLKPGNVLVTEVDGRPTPKVIDFGVAKATEVKLTEMSFSDVGAIVGTPAYMSPEQADPSSTDIDTRTDVYALGVMLYELLTGSPPIDAKQFKRGAILEMLRMVREVEPPRPSTKLNTADALPNIAANRNIDPAKLAKLLQGELDWVVMKALEKDRTRRYDTANGLAHDIQRYLADEVVEARPPSRGYRLKKFVKRNKGQVIAASLVLFVLLAGMAGTMVGFFRAEHQRKVAEANEKKAVEAAATERQALEREKKERQIAQVERARAEANLSVARTWATKLLALAESLAGLPGQGQLRKKMTVDTLVVFKDLYKYQSSDPALRRDLAKTLRLWANVMLADDLPAALQANQDAVGLIAPLADNLTQDGQIRDELAETLRDQANLLKRMGRLPDAAKAFERALEVVAGLRKESPQNSNYLRTESTVKSDYASLLITLDQLELALVHSTSAVSAHRTLADGPPLHPLDPLLLVIAMRTNAKLHRSLNHPREALGVLAEALRRATSQKVSNANWQYITGGLLYEQSKTLAVLGSKVPEAQTEIDESVRVFERLVRERSDSNRINTYSANLALGLTHLGDLQLKMGMPAESLEAYCKALAIQQKLVKESPSNPSLQNDLAGIHNALGRAHARLKQFPEAFAALDTGEAICKKLAKMDVENTLYRLGLAFTHAYRGSARVRAGQPAEAAADLRRAVELWAKVRHLDIEIQLEQCRTLALLAGLGGDMKVGVTADDAKAFADQSVIALADAINAGWANLAELKEPDFDAIRDRADCKKLLADLEAKAPKPAEPAPPPREKK